MTQSAKNLRQAFPACGYGTPGWSATQTAARWAAGELNQVDSILARMNLLEIAQRALVAGETLEEVGELGPYGSTAQRRAWAAGKLAAACDAMVEAERLEETLTRAAAKIAYLEKKLELARAETRAAARYGQIKVPFREKQPVSVDWDA